MSFTFRLEPLLRKAEYQENSAMRHLGEILRQVSAQEEKIARMTSERGEVIRHLELSANSVINLAQLASGSRAVLRLRGDILKQREVLAGLRQEAERRRVALMAATQEKRKLEKLRERQQTKFQLEEKRRDNVEQDEIAGRTDLFRRREKANEEVPVR